MASLQSRRIGGKPAMPTAWFKFKTSEIVQKNFQSEENFSTSTPPSGQVQQQPQLQTSWDEMNGGGNSR
jgi:hypothetical protein